MACRIHGLFLKVLIAPVVKHFIPLITDHSNVAFHVIHFPLPMRHVLCCVQSIFLMTNASDGKVFVLPAVTVTGFLQWINGCIEFIQSSRTV